MLRRNLMVTVLAAVVLVLGMGSMVQADENAVTQVLMDNAVAMEGEDTEAVLDTYHPEVLGPPEAVEELVEELEYIFDNFDLSYEVDIEDVTIEDETAQATYRQVTTAENGADFQDNEAHGVHFLEKYEGEWRIIGTQTLGAEPLEEFDDTM